MDSYVIAWPALGTAVLVFGFAPGFLLRLILILYPRDNPRRKELIGELYAVPRIERPFWVAEQFEVAIFEGVRERFGSWLLRRKSRRAERLLSPFIWDKKDVEVIVMSDGLVARDKTIAIDSCD